MRKQRRWNATEKWLFVAPFTLFIGVWWRGCHSFSLVPPSGSPVLALSWSPDGTRLACADQYGVTLRNGRTGTRLLGWPVRSSRVLGEQVFWSPDGRVLATGNRKLVSQWNAITGAPVGAPLIAKSGSIDLFGWTPDSRALLLARDFGRGEIVEVRSGASRWQLSSRYWLQAGALSPHGQYLVGSASPGQNVPAGSPTMPNAGVWNTLTGKLLWHFRDAQRWSVRDAAWAPDGKTVAVSGQTWDDSGAHTTITWVFRATDGLLLRELDGERGGGSTRTSLCYAPTGTMLATTSSNGASVHIWNVRNGVLLATLSVSNLWDGVYALAWSPRKPVLAVGTVGRVRFWNTNTWTEILQNTSSNTQR